MFIRIHFLSILGFFFAGSLSAQELSDSNDSEVTREKAIQWIETKKLIAKESAEWEGQKQVLNDLVDLRQREIDDMEEIISLAKERVDEIEKKQNSLEEETRRLRVWRRQFEKRVSDIEALLVPKLSLLPPPVSKRISESVERLSKSDQDTDLQTRFRDILAILNECVTFNNQIHTLPELREVDGDTIEVDVLYLGMNRAWYVDREGKRAGTGLPTDQGWVWHEDPSMASKVRKAINVQTKQEAPSFTALPIRQEGGVK